jgi:serine/threonine protein kinase
MLIPGRQPVPGYTLRGLLGAGAFGEVWEAKGPGGSLVAMKFLDCRMLPSSAVAAEMRVLRHLGDLRHPNIVEYKGVFSSSHYIILCMERADGNLDALRQAYREETGHGIPPDHLLDLLQQAARGLDFLAGVRLPGFNVTARGVQHCDVKPGNLLLVGETVKLADFGLCAGAGWTTHRKGWRGTPPYAAPELYHGQPILGTDQYALAVTYLDLIAGERPLWQGDPGGPPRPTPVDMTKISEREFPVISRALHPQPSARWPSCQQFIAALREAALPPRSTASRECKVVEPVGNA